MEEEKMRKKLLRKILMAGIIVLFIGAGAISSAVEINSDVNEKSMGKKEIENFDDYNEIISFVMGGGRGNIWYPNGVNLSGDITIIALTTNGFIIKQASQVEIKFFLGLKFNSGFGGLTIMVMHLVILIGNNPI
jgi:hypothetical protein